MIPPAALALFLLAACPACGDPIETITVVGQRAARGPTSATRQRIAADAIAQTDPVALEDVLRLAPAANLTTNSRGETLVFLRNAGERQTALFFDGALLNVPWDNRVDLSLVPAAALGAFSVVKGPVPAEYGANVLGGAVNATTVSPLDAGFSARVDGRRGEVALGDVDALLAGRFGDTGLLAAGGYSRRDGIPLPSGPGLPFNQRGDDLRTNTGREFGTLLLRGEHRAGTADLGVSLLYVDGEKEIAPEGHIDPDTGSVRFWRYPQWHMLMAIGAGEGRVGAYDWKASAWMQSFAQTIDSFESIVFDRRDERQEDDDLTVGSRFIAGRVIGDHRLQASLNAMVSTHDQINTPIAGGRTQAPFDFSFRQWLLSPGLAWRFDASDRLSLSLDGTVDVLTLPRTGDKPAVNDFVEWSLRGGAVYDLGRHWTLRGAVGRKARLPTMRELFGEAVGRFLINPDLQAETAVLAEIGLAYQTARARIEVVPFANFTDATIDRRNVTVDGRRLRQRVNLEGSRILGLEVTAALELGAGLALRGHATAMDVDRIAGFEGDAETLAERPELIARAALDYTAPGRLDGLVAQAEIVHRGRAFSQDEDNRFVPLEVSTVLNLRLGYDIAGLVDAGRRIEVFLRADNVFDTVVEPQLGLPAAGRWISGGIRLGL